MNLRAKSACDKLRNSLPPGYAVLSMDNQARYFLSEVATTWTCKITTNAGPTSEAVQLAGMFPSVRNTIALWNYQMPRYWWWSPERNRKAALAGVMKAMCFPVSVDQTFHVASDGHEALLWGRTNMAYMYRDEAGAMRESLYVKKKLIEPDGSASGSQPSRSEANPASSAAGSRR